MQIMFSIHQDLSTVVMINNYINLNYAGSLSHNFVYFRPLDNFLFSQPKQLLMVLKRTVSIRPKHMLQ